MLLLEFLNVDDSVVAVHSALCQGVQSVNEVHPQGRRPCFPAGLHSHLRRNPAAMQCASSSTGRASLQVTLDQRESTKPALRTSRLIKQANKLCGAMPGRNQSVSSSCSCYRLVTDMVQSCRLWHTVTGFRCNRCFSSAMI